MRLPFPVFILSVLTLANCSSCSRDPVSNNRSKTDLSDVETASIIQSTITEKPRFTDQWITSRDDKLALRLRALSHSVKAGESFVVAAEIENRSTEKLAILRPFGDDYIAVSHGIEIRNTQGKLAYTGPQRSYVIGAGGFTTLEPGDLVEDKIELPINNYAGIENAGKYALQYDYSYSGEWDTTAAKGGIQDAWRGWIRSGDVEIIREIR